MGIWKEEVKEIIVEGKISVPYQWTVGATLSRFYYELRDQKRIWGNKCSRCNKVFIPPKKKCTFCYDELREWIQLRDEGYLDTYTVVHYEEPMFHPGKPPLIFGIIKLDGADTGMVHLLGEVKPQEVRSGMRVKAVFNEVRNGDILDIKYFKPI